LNKIASWLNQQLIQNSYKYPVQLVQGGIISFTFDDFPLSAFDTGASILESYNSKGVFFMAGGLEGKETPVGHIVTRENLVSLNNKGHEIGSHTFSHIRPSIQKSENFLNDINENDKYLNNIIPGYVSCSFSYPYGECIPSHKKIIHKKYQFSRSIIPGINKDIFDASLLKANKLYSATFSKNALQTMLKKTKDCNGWIIFYTHDVSSKCSSFGCKPEQLRWIIEEAIVQGLNIKSLKEVKQYIDLFK
jgi:peptidoglycan/xylan/chitin deacetylase (PgdA/CDA1 family)